MPGIGRRQVKLAVLVFHAVPGHVQHQLVFQAGVFEEVIDCSSYPRFGDIEKLRGSVTADRRIREHGIHPGHVGRRRVQSAELRVGVRVRGDKKRFPAPRHPSPVLPKTVTRRSLRLLSVSDGRLPVTRRARQAKPVFQGGMI